MTESVPTVRDGDATEKGAVDRSAAESAAEAATSHRGAGRFRPHRAHAGSHRVLEGGGAGVAASPAAGRSSYHARAHASGGERAAVEALSHTHPARPIAHKPALIKFEDFCFAYDDSPNLRHIDLSIAAGDCSVLMGDNGCGKSTLLKAINGLIFAQRGTYLFDGQEVNEKTMRDPAFAKRLHQRVGFIFQDSDAQLFCSDVEEEIAFGPRQMGLTEEEVAARVDDVIGLLGIEKLRRRAPYHLSGGEKKKVAIGCILSMNPDVYCFDEPLNGLDIKTRTWLVEFFEQLKEAKKTLVIATHDQSLADRVADYFVYMGSSHGYTELPHVHINK